MGQENRHLEVDVAIREAIGTALVQEIYIFYQEAEEGNHNLRQETENKVHYDVLTPFPEKLRKFSKVQQKLKSVNR